VEDKQGQEHGARGGELGGKQKRGGCVSRASVNATGPRGGKVGRDEECLGGGRRTDGNAQAWRERKAAQEAQ